ncbi:recombinase family protein [Petralouisia muris]|uniref:Recombinase family protein n=1 Tax=Petralouisia muris TaxID=3032872 RepID=A0AC61RMN3_9FIRM|nr:recombinase family protein [Petralouisia muris]TGY86992.1 recombinase family protein [Petralouisia muris]
MAKNVTTIPATRNRFTADPISSRKKRKVAGYARVSTDMEDQQTSYAAQCDYYTSYIQSREDWEFVGLYSDEGISATSTRHREGFNKMVEDALDGKIDLIITKSVSRFARNTVDSLSTIRRLKDNGTECYFEKENIWTFDSKGELLITIMSSLAQEESRSISENCTWGMRKRFADGKVTVPFGRFLGYDRGEDGNLVVNEEQAKIVREIYGLFLQGRSPYQIAKILTEKGIPTPGGKKVWGKAVVESILTNEKYKGDALLQKVYTVDFLSKKKKVNEGEVPQYYVEGNHEAIIPPAVFDNVQVLMQSRGKGNGRNSCVSIFSSKIRCGDCGSWYGSKVWHSNDKYRKVVWQCNHKFDGGEKCTTPHLDEETIRQLFIKALNTINREKTRILAGFEEIRDTAFETGELEAEERQLNGEMNVAAELIQKCIGENARVAQNQGEYAKRYDALVGRFETAKARLEEVQAAITEKQAQRKMMENFMEVLRGLPEQVDYFDEGAWYAMVDFVTVYGKEDVRFTFKNGMEIPVKTK